MHSGRVYDDVHTTILYSMMQYVGLMFMMIAVGNELDLMVLVLRQCY